VRLCEALPKPQLRKTNAGSVCEANWGQVLQSSELAESIPVAKSIFKSPWVNR
jgi:hypothetical protein